MDDQISSGAARDVPRYDASVQPSVKSVFDREPLLIPQLFEDVKPQRYRRRSWILVAIVVTAIVAATAFAVMRFGIGTSL